MTARLITRDELLQILQVSKDWFARHRHQLAERGFPAPMAALRPAERWDPAAVQAWIDSQRPQHLHAGARAAGSGRPANDVSISETLAERARRLAGRL